MEDGLYAYINCDTTTNLLTFSHLTLLEPYWNADHAFHFSDLAS